MIPQAGLPIQPPSSRDRAGRGLARQRDVKRHGKPDVKRDGKPGSTPGAQIEHLVREPTGSLGLRTWSRIAHPRDA